MSRPTLQRVAPRPLLLQAWKDTSSGAIAAAGLLRLADAVGAPAAAQRYRAAAARMLRQLATAYLSSRATPPQPASILRNGTANAAKGNLGTGLIYGDCYFLEALAHWRRLRC